jgi:hypothetical protein
MTAEAIRIRMSKTVRRDWPCLGKPGTIAIVGKEYPASSNQYGAISAICDNGEKLGVKPGEFEFIEAPQWVWDIHLARQPHEK